MRPFLVFTSILILSLNSWAELSLNEKHVYRLNDVHEEFCGKTYNEYPRSNPSYYGCERTRKVLYSQAADLTKVESGDPEKPQANLLGAENVPLGVNVLRSYVVEPPLQNKPEPGKTGNRGIDWSRADALVRSAARNLIQPVMDQEGNVIKYDDGETIPNHGISHAFVHLQCEGLKPILTGMSTGKDIESPINFFVHNLGLGILFRTQVGRMNTYEELEKEIDIRRRKAGDLTFVDYKLNPENCRHIYYSIMELVAEGIQKRYGSLTDRMMNGTGMGCAMFDVGVKQMAGIIPMREKILSPQEKQKALENNPCEFSHSWNRTIYVPKDYLPEYDKDLELLSSAKVGILSMLLSGEDAEAFVYWASYLLNTLVETAQEKVEGMEELKGSEMVSMLSGFLESLSAVLAGSANSFVAKGILAGVQAGMSGETFINETLQPKAEGYPFDEGPNDNNETLSFWDPQLYANWTKEVHQELLGLNAGSLNSSDVACADWKKDSFQPKTDGLLIGLEVDWTQVDPPSESIFRRFDKERAFFQEDVDPFKEYDGDTKALPEIFTKQVLKASFE